MKSDHDESVRRLCVDFDRKHGWSPKPAPSAPKANPLHGSAPDAPDRVRPSPAPSGATILGWFDSRSGGFRHPDVSRLSGTTQDEAARTEAQRLLQREKQARWERENVRPPNLNELKPSYQENIQRQLDEWHVAELAKTFNQVVQSHREEAERGRLISAVASREGIGCLAASVRHVVLKDKRFIGLPQIRTGAAIPEGYEIVEVSESMDLDGGGGGGGDGGGGGRGSGSGYGGRSGGGGGGGQEWGQTLLQGAPDGWVSKSIQRVLPGPSGRRSFKAEEQHRASISALWCAEMDFSSQWEEFDRKQDGVEATKKADRMERYLELVDICREAGVHLFGMSGSVMETADDATSDDDDSDADDALHERLQREVARLYASEPVDALDAKSVAELRELRDAAQRRLLRRQLPEPPAFESHSAPLLVSIAPNSEAVEFPTGWAKRVMERVVTGGKQLWALKEGQTKRGAHQFRSGYRTAAAVDVVSVAHKHVVYGKGGCYSISELAPQPIFTEWKQADDLRSIQDVLNKEVNAPEPYTKDMKPKMDHPAFAALFDHTDLRWLARLGMEDIQRTDLATYQRMLENVPIGCEESFLDSFFTGCTISITFTTTGGEKYTLLLKLKGTDVITASCLFGHDDGNDADAQLGWGVSETVPAEDGTDVEDGRLRICVAGGKDEGGAARPPVRVLEVGSNVNLLDGFDGGAEWRIQLDAIEARVSDVAIEVVEGYARPYDVTQATQRMLRSGALAADGSGRRRVHLRLEWHAGPFEKDVAEEGWFLVLENNARTTAKYKRARHFATVPFGGGYARVALVMQQSHGVVESRQRRAHGAALVPTGQLKQAEIDHMLYSSEGIKQQLKLLAQMQRLGGHGKRSHSNPRQRPSPPKPEPKARATSEPRRRPSMVPATQAQIQVGADVPSQVAAQVDGAHSLRQLVPRL